MLLVPATIALGAAASDTDSTAGAAAQAKPKPAKPKPAKPKPTKPKPKPVAAPRTCTSTVPTKPKPKPAKPVKGAKAKPAKRPKPTKPSRKPARPIRSCPEPAKPVPAYVPTTLGGELGATEANGGNHGWAKLGGTLDAASTFTSPTGKGSSSIRMLGAPAATRVDYENGASYVTGSFAAIQVFRDRSMKESIVVPKRLGTKTWSWQLASSGAARPQVMPSGGVDLRNGLFIPPPEVTSADGSKLKAPAVWSLTPTGVLSLTTNDAGYPLPYVVDPGVAPTGAFTGFSSATGNTYVDPGFSLTRIFINSSQNGRFTVNASVNDPDDATQQRVCFPTYGTGWIQDGGCVAGSSGASNPGILATYFSGSTTANLAPYPGAAFTTTNYGTNPGATSCANQPGAVGPFSRVEPTVNSYANWTAGSNNDAPYTELCEDRFSARWQGVIRTPNEVNASDAYTFGAISDDGIRVIIDNTVVLADWGEHSPTWKSSCPINLLPNTDHNITVEYFENGADNRAQLRWNVPGTGNPVAGSCKQPGNARDTWLETAAGNNTPRIPFSQTTTSSANGVMSTGGLTTSWPVVPTAPTSTSPGLRMPNNSFSRTYEWTAGATAPPTAPQNIVFEDQAAPDPTPGTAPFTVIADGVGPIGGTITATAPAGGGLTTTPAAITLTWNANGTTDGVAGLSSGIAGTGSIWRQDAAFDNGDDTCDAFPSTWTSGNSTAVRTGIARTASVANDGSLDTGVVSGRCYRWALVFTDNVGNVGVVPSQVVRVDTNPPAALPPTFTPLTGTQWMHVAGTTVFYNNSGANTGTFSVDGSSLDLESGVDSLRFPPPGSGWTPNGAFNDNSAPFSNTYTWTSASPAVTGMQLRARDVAGNTSDGPAFNFTPDVTAPTGGAVTYLDGVWGSTSYNVGFTVGGDGTGAGVASWYLERRETTLPVSGTCDAFVAAWTPVGGANPTGSSLADAIVADHCYMYRLVVTDRVGNARTYTSPNVLKFDEQPPVAAFFDLTSTTGDVYRTPLTNRIWFNPASAGGFRMRATATDAIGMDRVAFPNLGAAGWSGPSPTDVLAPSGGYWVSSPFSWTAGASDPVGPHQIVARDTAGNTTSVPVEVDSDSTPPSGGLASPSNIVTNAATITVTTTAATDTQSGLRNWSVDMQIAPLVNGACGTWSAWAATGIAGVGTPPASSTYPTPATGCYRSRMQSTDNVGNTELGATSTNVLRVDKGNPTVAFTSPADNSDQTGTFTINGSGNETQTSLASVAISYTGPAAGTACATATLVPGTPGAWTWNCSWAAGALPDGLYTLTATATDAVGNSATSTWRYRLDNQPPTASWVSWTENSSGLHPGTGANRDLLWFNPAAPAAANGTATATVSATDAGSGMNRVVFPNLASAGWGTGGTDTTATGTQYSHGYTFTGGGTIGDPAPANASAFDNAGASTGAPNLAFRIEPDAAAPTGSTFTMAAGLQTSPLLTASANVGTDADSGVASWRVDYRFAELVDGTCGAWEPWGDGSALAGFNGTATNGTPVSLNIRIDDANNDGIPDAQESLCFQLQLFTTDNVGNTSTGPLSGIRRMDFGNPTTNVSVPTSGSGTVNVSGTATDAVVDTAPAYLLSGSGLDQVTVTYELPDGPDADSLPDATGTVCTTSTFTGAWTARAWTCPWNTSSLPDGSYTVRAVARDNAGRTSTIATGTVLLDNQAPVSAWHSWNDNGSAFLHATGNVAWVNPNAPTGSYALDARFTAYDLGSGMDRVDVPAFGPGWTPAGAGSATYTSPTPAANGWTRALTFTDPAAIGSPGVVSATARDNAGNTSTVPFELRMDGNAPTGGIATVVGGLQNSNSVSVSLTGAVEPALESGLASWIIQYEQTTLANDTCGAFTGTWAPAAGGVGIAPASYVHDVTLLPDGCYRYRVITSDNVGNSGTSANSTARRVDRTAPTATIAAPLTGSAQSGTFPVTGSAGDAHSGVDQVTLTWTGPASTSGTICASATITGTSPTWGWNCSWNTSALPDGAYTIRARSFDRASNASTFHDIVVTLDNQAPVSAWHSWNDNGSAYLHATGAVAWFNPTAPVGSYALDARFTAYDLGSGVDRIDVPAFGAGWTPSGASTATLTSPLPVVNGWTRALAFTNPATVATPGALVATARDNAGNASTVPFEVRADGNAPTGGAAAVTAGLQNGSSVAVTLTGAVEPALESGLASWTLQYDTAPLADDTCGTFGGTWTTASTGVGIAPASYAHDVTLLGDGCYRYRVQSTDNVGNVGSSAASAARRVDRTLPTTAVALPLSGSAQSGTFSISGSADDVHSGVDHVTLTWMGPASTSGTICANATLTGSSPTWAWTCSWNTSALPDGTYTIRARSYDRATNVSTNTDIVVLLDNNPPFLGFHSFTETSPYTHWAGPVGTNRSIWFNPTAPAGTYSFGVNVISYDAGTGVDRVEFAGAGTGWTPGVTAASDTTASSTPVANSYTGTYTFDTGNGGLVDPPTLAITSYDPASNPSTTDFDVLSDNLAPNSGSLTYTDGYVPSTSVSVGVATGTDGAGSGVATWRLLRDTGTLTAGSCGGWSGYAPVAGASASGSGVHTGTASDTVTDGGCFRYRLETTDNVGNVGVVTATEVIRVDLTPPTGSIVLAPNANPTAQYLATPTRLFVNTNQAGSFDANVTAGAASGVLDVAFPTIATGFSPSVTQPGPGTTFSRTYAWTAAAGAPAPPQQATVRSQSLGSLAVPFEVVGDAAAPTGAATTYASGFTSATSLSVAFTPGTDGTGSGVASWQLQRDTGTLAAGACTWNNTWTAAGPASDAGPYVEGTLAQATCYRYRVQSTDRVGNVATSIVGGPVMVDQTAPTAATVTLAAVTNPTAQYQPAGDSVWINPNVAGSFTATVAATDAESGTGASTFPTLGSGWTNGGSGSTITYTWAVGATAPSSPTVVVANGSGMTTSIPFTVQLDGAAPAGATLDQENGFVTDFLVDTTFAGGTDAGSGLLSWRFERRSAPYAVGTDTCSPWGGWSAYPAPLGHPTSPFVDSSVAQPTCYQYRLVETDRVGNVQTTLDGDTAKVIDDIFPPAAFAFIPPTAATLPAITTAATAPACGAALTYTSATPVIDWADSSDAESGLGEYRVYVDGASTPLGTVPAPTSTWTASTLADGPHTIGVRAVDNQGNATSHTAPYPAAIRVDSAPPTATSTTPADLVWTTDTTPTLSWSATDANCVARVEVYVDDMSTPVAVASGTETSWTPSGALAEGTHTWRVEAIDGAGRRTSSATRTVGIDTTAPNAFAITTPASSTTVRGFIAVTWNASGDAGSGLAPLAAYTVYVDGIARTTVAAGTTTATLTGITNGAHTLEVRATDAVGNVTPTASISFTGYPAILPPVLDTPAAGAAINAVPTLDWHWVSDGGPAPTDYDVEVDGSVVGNVLHPTSDLAIADPTDGTHTWRVVQHDPYTGTVQTAVRTFVLDRTAPVAPATLTRVATTISWAAASDPAAPVASGVQNVRFQVDGTTVATLAAGATSYNYGALPDGTYVMRLLVTDNAGNTSTSGTITVVNDSVPPTAFALDAPAALPALPAITAGPGAPSCGAAPTYVTATPALTWQPSSDATSGLDGYTVIIDGATAGTTAAGVETFTPSSALSGGAHTWQVVARDVFGLTRTSTPAPMNVRVDGADPTVALVTPAANAFTSDTTPTLTWNGSDDNCLARAEVTLDGTVQDVLSGPVSSWTPATALTEGAHTWSVRVFDSAGKVTASASRTVNVDTTAPTGITAIAPVHASTTPEGMLTFSWSAGSDGTGSGVATYDLQVDGTPRAANLAAPTFGTLAIHAGAHTWRVRVVDQVGNAATYDFTFTASVVPDVSAPDAFNLLTPANAATIPTGTALTWEPAYDFNGIAQYRVFIDGTLTGTTAGNVTSFTPAAGAGSPICSIDFDPATAASCVTSPQFSNGKTSGSATVLPSPASSSWGASAYAGWSSSGGAFGVGNPVTNTGWDGDRTWTGMDYQVAVPSTGADLRFEHRYRTQRVGNNAYDGGTLELMVDAAGDGFGNDTWRSTCAYGTRAVYGSTFDCTYEIVEVDGGYDAVLEGPAASSMPYRNVFSGDSGGMKQTRVRLDDFAGKNIRVRFKLGGDACYVGRSGCSTRQPRPAIWHIDQLTLANKSLLPGLHTWNVVAVDPAGNTRPSAQTWSFNLS